MKSTLTTTLALLLMCIVPHSYGMSGDELGHDGVFDPVSWLTSLTRPFKRQRREGETVQLQMPLASLERQGRIETKEQLPLSQLSSSPQVDNDEELARQASSQLSLTNALEHEAEQKDCIEQLPLEVFHKHIAPHLSTEDLKHIAGVSRACRTLAQFSMTHLSINLDDLTKEKLEEIKCKFKNIKSLNVYKKRLLKPKDIELLAKVFPNLDALDLSGTVMDNSAIRALSKPGTFANLKILDISAPKNRGGILTNHWGIKALADASFANELESLNLYNTGLSEEGAKALFRSNAFIALKRLNLGGNGRNFVGGQIVGILKEAPFAKQLEELNLYGSHLWEDDIAVLSEQDAFPALKVLNLGDNTIKDGGLKILQQAPFAGQLESLKVSEILLTSTGVTQFAQSDKFRSLKNLNLAANEEVGDAGVKSLAGASFANQLESLDVSYTKVTQEGIRTLSQPEVFKSLKKLNLGWINIQDIAGVITALINAPFASQLESLNLEKSGMNAEAIQAMSQSEAFPHLKMLNFAGCSIGDKGLEILMQASFAANLESLDLENTKISLAGVKVLAQQNALPVLKVLNLSWNKIGDDVIDVLIKAPFVGKLELLDLRKTNITDAGKQRLEESGIAKTILV